MARLISFLLSILPFVAYAQSKGADEPSPQGSTTSVILFLVLFFGSIVAYAVYLWWTARRGEKTPPAE